MSGYRLSPRASEQLDDIYAYSVETFGRETARRYVRDLFACFDEIAAGRAPKRALPAELEVDGYLTRRRSHLIFWRRSAAHGVVVAAILHKSMDVASRLGGEADRE